MAKVPLAGPLRARPAAGLSGVVRAPGDKSISHRALIFGALAEGETHVRGMLEGDDVMRTASAMRSLGARIERDRAGDGAEWRIAGAPWREPGRPLYFGNSGTGCRLVMGAAAGARVAAAFDGDASLRARPMGRIAAPLSAMGANVSLTDGRLPCMISPRPLMGVRYELPTPSAQVKSAALLAALGADSETAIDEPEICRDHTERMLGAFGADISVEPAGQGRVIRLKPGKVLRAQSIDTPGDPSSAAFLVAAALVTEGADILIENVLVNPTRTGFYDTVREMGADVTFENARETGGEPVADIRARSSSLSGVSTPASRAPSMIDEYPILAVLAAYAAGDTYMAGVSELRVKETDRIAASEAGLQACGVDVESGPDWIRVFGRGRDVRGLDAGEGRAIETRHDHRIAMSFLVLGLAARDGCVIDDGSMIATSFPTFLDLMADIGALIEPA